MAGNNLAAGPIWQQRIALGGDCPIHDDGTVASGSFANGVLYYAGAKPVFNGHGSAGSISALDAGTGQVLWTRQTEGSIFGSPAYVNGMIAEVAGSTFEVLAGYLRERYAGGRVLADDSAASTVIFSSNLDLREFVTPGFHRFWEHAIRTPSQNVRWAIAVPGDAISTDLAAHPDRFVDFRVVVVDGNIRLFERINA